MNPMMTLNAATRAMAIQLLTALLMTCPRGALVQFSYTAGRPATARAIEEAAGQDREVIVGRLHAYGVNKDGELYVTVVATNRTCLDGGPAYRSINPSVGTLHGLSVLAMA